MLAVTETLEVRQSVGSTSSRRLCSSLTKYTQAWLLDYTLDNLCRALLITRECVLMVRYIMNVLPDSKQVRPIPGTL